MANHTLAQAVQEKLETVGNVRHIPMMGGYIFYYREKVIGGIYEPGFMLKVCPTSLRLLKGFPMLSPYEGAKQMILVDQLDQLDFLEDLLEGMYQELPERKPRKSKKN